MTRRATVPLDSGAVRAADDAFYAAHPELIDASGQRIPLDATSPEHAAYRSEWMDLYVANGGPVEGEDPAPPDGPIEPCPSCWIKFQFLSKEGDYPLPGVNAVITDPNGKVVSCASDALGVIEIAPAVPGSYRLEMPLDGLTLSQVFDFSGQAQAAVPVTASQAPPPARVPRHAAHARASGAPPPADANAERAEALPWYPLALAVVETRKVRDGNTLESLAAEVGWTWDQLAFFNFGTSVPEQINAQLRDLVGCTGPDAAGNYRFRSSDDPGLMFLPRPVQAEGLAINTVHLFRGTPVRRPAKLELQTVDGLGYRLGNVSLRLVHVDAREDQVTTDGNGYWTDTLLLEGPVDVYHPNGQRAEFYADRYRGGDQRGGNRIGVADPEYARLDPLLVRRSISHVLVPGAVAPAVLDEHDTLRRRYGRSPLDLAAARAVAAARGDHESEAAGKASDVAMPLAGAATVRYRRAAVDNLFATAYAATGTGASMRTRFLANLDDWLRDKHPTTVDSARGHYLLLVLGGELIVGLPRGGGALDIQAVYELGDELSIYAGKVAAADGSTVSRANLYGAYAEFEVNGGLAMFYDLETRTQKVHVFQPDGATGNVPVWDLCKHPADRDRARQMIQGLEPRVGVLYLHPESDNKRWNAAFWGCSGLLENYPADSGVAARAHQRNLDVVTATDHAYRNYLMGYIGQVQVATDAEALQALGPPYEPFRFVSPAGASASQALELASASRESSFPAWKAIADRLASLEEKHTSGSIFLRLKMEVGPGTPGAVDGGGKATFTFNFDIGSDGCLQKSEKWIEVALGPNELEIDPKLLNPSEPPRKKGDETKMTAHQKWGVDPLTGETKQTWVLSMFRGLRGFAFEYSSDGTLKVQIGINYVEWNSRTAEGGFGFCLPLGLLMKGTGGDKSSVAEDVTLKQNKLQRTAGWVRETVENATVCVGLHFVLIRLDQLLAYLVRAPGFFERRLIAQLLVCNWHSLSGFERAQLGALGWQMQTWDRLLPGDYPESTKLDYADLSPSLQVAAVKLGFRQLDWLKTWQAAKAKYPSGR